MKAENTIKLAIWVISISFMALFFLLPSCSNEQKGQLENAFRKVSKAEEQTLRPTPNNGRLLTFYNRESILLSFRGKESETAKIIRIYDQSGGLKYMVSNPDFSNGKTLEINCTYFDKGEYLILLYLSGGELLEETIEIL